MKKATTKHREPSRSSLREMPPLVLGAYQVRRNPYAARIRREGVELVHDGPSQRSLAELPEADFKDARVRRNRYASRAAESAAGIQYGRGRPAAGHERGATLPRSLRLPAEIWAVLEGEAGKRKTTVHALLREIVAAHILRRGRG